MVAVATVASVVLGVAFVVAGAAKLASGDQWPVLAAALGVPQIAMRVVVPVLPIVEIVVGSGLIVQLWPRALAVLALVMLAGFSVQLARELAGGRHPVCACFGTWSARPLGPSHLVRNGLLAVLAAVVIVGAR